MYEVKSGKLIHNTFVHDLKSGKRRRKSVKNFFFSFLRHTCFRTTVYHSLSFSNLVTSSEKFCSCSVVPHFYHRCLINHVVSPEKKCVIQFATLPTLCKIHTRKGKCNLNQKCTFAYLPQLLVWSLVIRNTSTSSWFLS